MRVFVSILLLVLSVFQLAAQNRCSSDEKLKELMHDYPDYAQTRQLIKEQAQEWISNHGSEKTQAVITIPVVVHVVYANAQQNISDAQIWSQIQVLNEDYRKLNANFVNTPSEFLPVAADMEIQFVLAGIDPFGNPSSGITRTETTVANWNGSDLVKSTSDGGIDGWNRNKYLNIWVCNIGSGLLGYAYPPGAPSYLDGVVIGYKYFGTTGVLQSPFNKGRTATHEIGHWLNLDHPWGFNENNSNCTSDDGISDTPKLMEPNFGCPSFPHKTCTNNPDNGDMFMNYMDYTNDACMTMFTEGQKAEMHAVLNGPRAGIKNANIPAAVNYPDAVGVLDLYPNPTRGEFTLELKETPNEPITYTLVNSIGAVVMRGVLSNRLTRIEATNQQAGIYFLNIETGQGHRTVKKLLITR